MDSLVGELFASPSGLAIALLAAPWLAMMFYVAYLARTKSSSPAVRILDRDLQETLIKQANESISALRKTDVYHSRELVLLRERVAKIEAIIDRYVIEERP